MGIYMIPFVICLVFALVPLLIQLMVCMATQNLKIRMIPVIISAVLLLAWAYQIAHGLVPVTPYLGYALDWMLWQCMCAAMIIAHGVPFLILGHKK